MSLLLWGQVLFSQQTSAFEFKESTWDFGRIKEDGGVVSHTFEFVNKGTKPMVIETVFTSCGCTGTKYSKEPVMPGGKGSITVVFSPLDRPGSFDKELVISSDKGNSVSELRVMGFVVAKPRKARENYPYPFGNGLRLDNNIVYFNFVGQGTVVTRSVGYVNRSKKTVTLAVEISDSNSVYALYAPRTVMAGDSGVINIRCDLSRREVWGPLRARVRFVVDGFTSDESLLLSGIGTDNFPANILSAGVPLPKAVVSPLYYDFGTVVPAVANKKKIVVRNDGDTPLTVRAVKTGDGVKCDLQAGTVIKPRKSIEIEVQATFPAGQRGKVLTAYIVFNDPRRPMHEIRLLGTASSGK